MTDDFFDDHFFEEESSVAVYVVCIYKGDLCDFMEDGAEAGELELVSLALRQVMRAILVHVDEEAKFFLPKLDGSMQGLTSVGEAESLVGIDFPNGHVQLCVLAKSKDYWDDEFVRVSIDTEAYFEIWGYHHAYDIIARQGYADGDFNTGIISNNNPSFYSSDEEREAYGISDKHFAVDNYV